MKESDKLLYWACVNFHPIYEQHVMGSYEKERMDGETLEHWLRRKA